MEDSPLDRLYVPLILIDFLCLAIVQSECYIHVSSCRLTNVNEEEFLFGVRGSSGGYAETIFRYAAKTLFGRQIDGPLSFKNIRNSDFQEVALEVYFCKVVILLVYLSIYCEC